MAENVSLIVMKLVNQQQLLEVVLDELSRIRLALSEITDLNLETVVSTDLEAV
jgi:hypothetical protein